MSRHDQDSVLGVGVGLGLSLAGLLCGLFLPDYLGVGQFGQVALYSLGFVAGGVGVGGALIELERLWGVQEVEAGTLGSSLFVLGFAGTFHVIQAALSGGWAAAMRWLVAGVALLGATMFGVGVATVALADRSPRPDEVDDGRPRASLVTSVLTGLIGLATAVVNLMRAV